MDPVDTKSSVVSEDLDQLIRSRGSISFSKLLGAGMSSWLRSLDIILPCFALLLLPAAYALFRVPIAFDDPLEFSIGNFVYAPIRVAVGQAILAFASQLFLGLTIVVQAERVFGRPCSFAEGIRRIRGRAISLLASSLAVAIAVGVCSMLFVLPGLIAFVSLAPMACVVVREELSGVAAVRRCLSLTSGHRFLLLIIVFGCRSVMVALILTGAMAFSKLAFDTPLSSTYRLQFGVTASMESILDSILVAFYLVAKARRDGPEVGALANVFE